MINVTLKGGVVKEYAAGTTAAEVASSLGAGLCKAACAARIDGKVCDLRAPLERDCELEILTFDDEDGRRAFRHTASHVLAQAVTELYPSVKLAIGPAIDNGFYYDFDYPSFTDDDLAKISARMQEIVSAALPLERFSVSRAQAKEIFADQPYKLELIADLPEDEELSCYRQGGFTDLCAGPHLPDTGRIKAFKLTSCTGAYWRGDEKRPALKRIYGTAFPKASELTAYLEQVEEAKLRDHNRIGRELDYFTTVDYIGQGLPIMLPNGAKTLQILQRFVEDEEYRRGYILTKTPFMAKRELYKISGHWQHYRENMFILGDPDDEKAEVFALRPMTCPFQFQVYLSKARSYRDLPMRLNETSTLFRNEASGEMHGLIRVRQFTISEGHIACLPSQLEQEFSGCLDLAQYLLKAIGLDDQVSYRFSRWDPKDTEKYIGTAEQWDAVQGEMKRILDDIGLEYTTADGEAAFYGPKLDVQIRNVHGKEDTLVTIQIDFALAERFGMEYTDADGEKKYPYVIHRTSIGCYERTLALLLEKYAGALPCWMSAVQVRVIPVSQNYEQYADGVRDAVNRAGFRAETDSRNEKIGYRIREARMQKIPYILVVGENEVAANTVTVRVRGVESNGETMSVDAFLDEITRRCREFK